MPTVFVAFGVTGDLMAGKILPGLLQLHLKGQLPEDLEILGVSRRDWDDATLRAHIVEVLKIPPPEEFLKRFTFVKGDISETALFSTLAEKIGERQAILYFSLSPSLYKDAFEKLVASPLGDKKSKQLRLMIEKPFGTSEASAHELRHVLATAFSETQIYRIDHYLAKESLHDLPPMELPLIDSVHVYFLEKMNVENRGEFYDATGALRDVGQNHTLEMFARAMSKDRQIILESLTVLASGEAETGTVRAQYDGYLAVKGVSPHSQTETYFKVTTKLGAITVVLEGGKAWGSTRKEIVITFKNGTEKSILVGENKNYGEYEKLVYECLRGDHTLFVSMDEVVALWRLIDPILIAWKNGAVPLGIYSPGATAI